jgi:5-methylcytosine-specific restriction endonuclease McrA
VKRAPLTRKTPMARGAATLARAPLAPGKPKRRKKRPAHVRDAVRKRSHGRCVVCLHDREPRPERIAHLHHVLEVQNWPELEIVADNLIGLCVRHHEQHTKAFRRVPMAALPDCAVTLAHTMGGRAVLELERFYPR